MRKHAAPVLVPFAIALVLASLSCQSAPMRTGAAAAKEEAPETAPGPWLSKPDSFLHKASLMAFPKQAGTWTISETRVYDKKGLDCSANYVLRIPFPALITLYVYPAPKAESLSTHFAGIMEMLVSTYKGAKVKSVKEDGEFRGERMMSAILTYKADTLGESRALGSRLYLLNHSGWFVKVRLSYPAENEAEVDDYFMGFMRDIGLPEKGM